ncbi:hypothetical protein QBC32DRAFT_106074 [Pseudoneurospora amorphoporcata]|uniref:Uncharacterized protein n=1 Tax=Pseudoneurospora amorphoporcata TaxID=241081 RepID=A0AAN6NJJ8_9PEZI|nr:hypothetical protein QBC32DRAFT_106074 [Pseudoneurospora amorphoporcata]
MPNPSCNPTFSGCETKPHCLRAPDHTIPLLLSITSSGFVYVLVYPLAALHPRPISRLLSGSLRHLLPFVPLSLTLRRIVIVAFNHLLAPLPLLLCLLRAHCTTPANRATARDATAVATCGRPRGATTRIGCRQRIDHAQAAARRKSCRIIRLSLGRRGRSAQCGVPLIRRRSCR